MFLTITLNPATDCSLRVHQRISPGGVHDIKSERRFPGGKGINVARVLAGNGAAVKAGGLLGHDDAEAYVSFLKDEGVSADFFEVAHPVRRNLMFVDDEGQEMKFNRPGFVEMDYDADALHRYLWPLIDQAECICLCGSLPSRFPASAYVPIIAHCKSKNKLCVVDTSGPALRAAVEAGADVIKPNRRELGELCGQTLVNDADLVAAAKQLTTSCLATIVSDGAQGAYFVTPDRATQVITPSVAVVDSSGAGDTLLGQFVADAFIDGQLVITDRVIARAVAAGTVSTLKTGVRPLDPEHVQKLADQVRLRNV
ncbi:MAG: 1-phosphofructokinase family hexose kinase [Kiritimatiellae bacterium]|nr:1-phosphofructokinase family hexose kinase [Kiritimatiellia bacterium]